MITRDRYDGCHKEVAEALRKDQEIRCVVNDDDDFEETREVWINGYTQHNGGWHYHTGNGESFGDVTPVEEKVRVLKNADDLAVELIAKGFCPTSNGDWVRGEEMFQGPIFNKCGEEFSFFGEWENEAFTELV